jgi:hypothetical protein
MKNERLMADTADKRSACTCYVVPLDTHSQPGKQQKIVRPPNCPVHGLTAVEPSEPHA